MTLTKRRASYLVSRLGAEILVRYCTSCILISRRIKVSQSACHMNYTFKPLWLNSTAHSLVVNKSMKWKYLRIRGRYCPTRTSLNTFREWPWLVYVDILDPGSTWLEHGMYVTWKNDGFLDPKDLFNGNLLAGTKAEVPIASSSVSITVK